MSVSESESESVTSARETRGRGMTAGATRLIAGREMRETFRRKSFWAVIAVLFVGATAAMIVPELLEDDADPKFDVAVVGRDEALDDAVVATADAASLDVDLTHVDSASVARDRVEDDRSDIAIVAGRDPRIIARADENGRIVAVARQAMIGRALVESLESEGLSQAQIASATDTPTPRLQEVDAERSGRRTTAFVVSFVLYLLLLTLMIQVANGVAIEKANRISEVLLAIVKPFSLLFGKVIGVGIIGLVTISAAALPVLVKIVIGGDLPDGTLGAIGASIVWFALGLALYLTIAGSLGALVERQEETGSVIAPLTFILIGTFVVAQSSAETPVGIALAIFPLTSPLMMPARIAVGAAGPVEIAASVLLLVGAIVLAARVGSMIYARAIVRTGRRLKVRDVLRSS